MNISRSLIMLSLQSLNSKREIDVRSCTLS